MLYARIRNVAVALNNLGVTLLHRGFYRDALICFQDAIMLMTLLDEGNYNIDISNHLDQSRDLDNFLHTAFLKLANSTRKQKKKMNGSDFVIEMITYTTNDDSMISIANETMSSYSGYAIRIDESDVINDEIDQEIIKCLMLFNAGTLYRCYATNVHRPISSKARQKHAYLCEEGLKACNLANSIISPSVSFPLDEDLDGSCHRATQLRFSIAMLVLQNLMYLSSQNSDNIQAREYYQKLGDIKCCLISVDSYNTNEVYDNLSAAQAA